MAVPPHTFQILQLYAEHERLVLLRRGAGLLWYLDHEDRRQRRQRRQRRPRRRPQMWTASWLSEPERRAHSMYYTLHPHLEDRDPRAFLRLTRFSPEMWHELLQRVGPMIQKEDTQMRLALEPGLKLAVTLRYLATGESFRSLAFQYRVAASTICKFVPEVCEAIIHQYAVEVMTFPSSEDDWKKIAEDFQQKWNLPHCLGALDGKHVAIRNWGGGSTYFNYKKFHSIVIMAIADANYKFISVEIGKEGSLSDTIIWNDSPLKASIEANTVNWPEADPMPNDNVNMPYFLVGDDAFGLKTYLMKPYSRRALRLDELIYNYRISRARRVVENAFGLLVQVFRCLLNTLQVKVNKATQVTYACVVLHNLLRDKYVEAHVGLPDRVSSSGAIIPGAWRRGLTLFGGETLAGGNYGSNAAKMMRDTLKAYFVSAAGSVEWQHRAIEIGGRNRPHQPHDDRPQQRDRDDANDEDDV